MTKYKAIPTVIDNIRFSSKREAARYNALKLRMLAHQITELELQPTYAIEFNGIKICKVKLDFKYFDKALDRYVIEDSKGFDNPMSKLKRKLVYAFHGVEVQIV